MTRGKRRGCSLTSCRVLGLVINRSQVEKEASDDPVRNVEKTIWTATADLRSFQAPGEIAKNSVEGGWKCVQGYRLKDAC